MKARIASVLTLLVIFCLSLTVNAQEIKVKSNDFFVDFTKSTPSVTPPVIEWISPQQMEYTVKGNSYKIKIKIESNTVIESVSIFINGKDIGQERGFKVVEDEQTEGELEQEIFLMRGKNEVEIVARNAEGGISSEKRIIFSDDSDLIAAAKDRRDYALLIASDNYEHWDNLVNPVNDALTIADELKRNYGFIVDVVKNPTADDIMIRLKAYSQKSYMENDQLFIFIAGHGHFDDSFKEGYVVATNSLKVDQAKTSYISHSNLRTIINNIPCNHILLTMDVCFGGTFDQTIARSGMRGGEEDRSHEMTESEFILRKLEYKTRRYLTSGGKEYVPDGRPGHHSPFARKMLEGLRNFGGSDKILTLPELSLYMEKLQPEPRIGEFGDNVPGSDFLFIAK